MERERFIVRQPPTGEKDDYDCEKSWISDGLPSSSSRRRRGDVRGVDVRVGLGLSVLSFGIISTSLPRLLVRRLKMLTRLG